MAHPTERYEINPDTECWDWTGSIHHTGYGQLDSRTWGTSMAHRYIFELHRGPIPEGLTLDHLCRNIICVNPAHLEPVTAAENARRMQEHRRMARFGEATPTCPQGHLMDESNRTSQGTCKACKNLARRWARLRKRGAAPGGRPLPSDWRELVTEPLVA